MAKTRAIDLTGKRFYRWAVISIGGRGVNGHIKWECKCDCGNIGEVFSSNLIRGISKSCGCYDREATGDRSRTHGMGTTRMFKIWVGVRKRCANPKTKSYKDYGGRGIKVCQRWDKFEHFYEDMLEGYEDHLTLERKDPNGDYTKINCKWATMKEQARNKRNSVYIQCEDRLLTAAEWEEISGTGRCTIRWRIKNGWDTREAIFGEQVKSLHEISQYIVF